MWLKSGFVIRSEASPKIIGKSGVRKFRKEHGILPKTKFFIYRQKINLVTKQVTYGKQRIGVRSKNTPSNPHVIDDKAESVPAIKKRRLDDGQSQPIYQGPHVSSSIFTQQMEFMIPGYRLTGITHNPGGVRCITMEPIRTTLTTNNYVQPKTHLI